MAAVFTWHFQKRCLCKAVEKLVKTIQIVLNLVAVVFMAFRAA